MKVAGRKFEFIDKLPPITEKDRQFKVLNDGEGECTDLGEDIEVKEALAKKYNWRKAEKPLVRVLMRSGDIILYADYYYHYMMDAEQAKDYYEYKVLVEKEKKRAFKLRSC